MKKALSVFLSLLLAVSAVSYAVPGVVARMPLPSLDTSGSSGVALLPFDNHYVLASDDAWVEDLLYELQLQETHAVYEDGVALGSLTSLKTGMTVHPIEDATAPAVHTVSVLGEVDGDGAIDAKDALKVLQHSVKLVNLEGAFQVAADVSQDLAVDATDALQILQYTVKLIEGFWFESERPFLCDDPITLKVQGPVDDVSLLQAVVDFQKRYSSVKIRLEQSDAVRTTSMDSLKMQLASKKAPDVILMKSEDAVACGMEGYLLDLRQFGAMEKRDQFVPSCWNAVKSPLPGEVAQFGLPLEAYTMLMFYNKGMLERAGVTQIPQTWSELTQALNRLCALPEVTTPFNLHAWDRLSAWETGVSARTWLTYLWRLGGDVLTPDLKSSALQSEAGMQALQMYVDLVANYGVSDEQYNDQTFLEGKAGFDLLWSHRTQVTVDNPDMDFGAAMLPELKEGVPRYSHLNLTAIVLPNKLSDAAGDIGQFNQDFHQARWAYEFAEFYATSLEYQLEYGREHHSMPSLKTGEGSLFFQGDYWNTAYRQLEVSKPGHGVRNWRAIELYIAQAIKDAVVGDESLEKILEDTAKQINRQLT